MRQDLEENGSGLIET